MVNGPGPKSNQSMDDKNWGAIGQPGETALGAGYCNIEAVAAEVAIALGRAFVLLRVAAYNEHNEKQV